MQPRSANEALSPTETAVLLRINQRLLEADSASCCYPNNVRPEALEFRRLLIETLDESRDSQGGSVALTSRSSEAASRISERIVCWINARKPFMAGNLDDLQSTKQPAGEPPPVDGTAIDAEALRLLVRSGRLAVARELDALAHLKEVEQARDWWHQQSNAWQAAAQR
jgi:hypothetical protein